MKMLQSVNAAFERQGFKEDVRLISQASAADFMQANESQDVISMANSKKTCRRVQLALRQLLFSTSMVLLTDGYRQRCRHLGHALNLYFGALNGKRIFYTQLCGWISPIAISVSRPQFNQFDAPSSAVAYVANNAQTYGWVSSCSCSVVFALGRIIVIQAPFFCYCQNRIAITPTHMCKHRRRRLCFHSSSRSSWFY